MVGATRVPGDLAGLLSSLEIIETRNGRPFRVPMMEVPHRIGAAFGVWTTEALLELPARSFDYGNPSRIALANQLRKHLTRTWGAEVVLGCLSPMATAEADAPRGLVPARGPPGTPPPPTGQARRTAGLALLDLALDNLKARGEST